MSSAVVLILIAAFAFSAILTGAMRRYALRKKLLDVPNSRSSHSIPTPRGGGVAIVAAFFAALLALFALEPFEVGFLVALLAGAGAVAIVGFVDDRQPVPAAFRFVVHLLAALLVVLAIGGVPEQSLGHWGLHGTWLGAAIGVLILVWATNLFNFMDGIDGIAASEAIFVAGAAAYLEWQHGNLTISAVALCVAGASLGFLLWNWPPAKIFMGDVGSGFLGFILATIALQSSQQNPLPIEVWAILGGVFLVDASVTLLRRMLRGDRWFEAHHMHAYQHLARRWRGHLPVTCSVAVVNLIWLMPWAWLAASAPARASWCLAAALTPLIVMAVACGAGSREH